MKKVMTVFLAAAIAFAAAGQASAATFETKGEFRARYWYLSDYFGFKGPLATAASDSSMDMWDQRFRLGMGWQVSDTVKINARADILENVWDFTTGTNDDKTVGGTGKEIDFDWAWADIQIGANSKLQVGKMDVTWGPGVYAKADNRYRLRVGSKFDKVTAGLAYDMVTETFDTKGVGDNGALTLGAAMPVGDHTFGLLGIYSDNKATLDTEKTLFAIDGYWLGAVGPAKFTAEAAWATGTTDNKNAPDTDREGLMAYIGATMPVGPVGVGLEFGYSKGDDPGTADDEGAIFHDYNGPFNSFILFNNFDLDGWNSVYSGGADKGLNNAMALKASATFAASKQLSFMGALVWAQADQTRQGQDDNMGIEVDALAKYALTENVTLQAGVGYLSAGDYYEVLGQNPDDPLVVTAHAIVTF
jgi:hypothetical protein